MIISSNGVGGGNWSNPATWIGGVVPVFPDEAEIKVGDTVDEVPLGQSCIVNYGTIVSNVGHVTSNVGTVTTSENGSWIGVNMASGVVVANIGTITDNHGTVITNLNNGIVVDNYLTVATNDNLVPNNWGTVLTNNALVSMNNAGGVVNWNSTGATVNFNGAGAVVATNRGIVSENAAGATIPLNEGFVGINAGTIVTCRGLVTTNTGVINNLAVGGGFTGHVETNDATIWMVGAGALVDSNNGTVGTNRGRIEDNYGTVTLNDVAGYVFHNWGTVTTNSGVVSFLMKMDSDLEGTIIEPTAFSDPSEDNVKSGTAYRFNSATKTGSLTTGGGSLPKVVAGVVVPYNDKFGLMQRGSGGG